MKALVKLALILITAPALAQSGNLDSTFGINGKVVTGFGRSEANANSVAVQPDGKIICGGRSYSANTNFLSEGDSYNALLVRYNVDGSLDSSFGINGIVSNQINSFSSQSRIYTGVYAIKLQNDGKILTYGFRGLNALYGGYLMITRYNPDGSVDTGFGDNGIVYSGGSPIGNNALQIQPDGKLVVLSAEVTPVTYATSFVLERFNENGTIDATFGTNGKTTTSFGYVQNNPGSLALQPDGKILAIGSGNANTLIARYTTAGVLDNTFSGDGKVITSFGIGTNNPYISVLPDGKILTAGLANTTATNNFSLVRYNANGSIDATFDGDGRTLAPFDSSDTSYFINSVAQQTDGKFLVSTQTVAADYFGNIESFVIRRYTSDGSVDTTFGINGKVSTAIQTGSHVAKCISLQADAKILVAGYSNYVSQDPQVVDLNLLRFHTDGNLDASFSNDGIVSTKIESSNDNGSILLKQPDEKLLLIGVKKNNALTTMGSGDIILSRYNPDGSLDPTFGIMGKSIFAFGQNVNNVTQAALQADGKILVANGYYSFPSTSGNEIIRFNANGSIDSSFGNAGKISIPYPVVALHTAANKFFIISYGINPNNNNDGLVLRCFNTSGTIDTSFGNNGEAFIGAVLSGTPQIVSQTDGKIIISFSPFDTNGASGFGLIRFNSNGTLDTGFENGILVTDFSSVSNAVFIEPDGKIIVAGKSIATNGGTYTYYQFVTARYLSDGSLDATYGTDGVFKTFLGDLYSTSYNIIKSIAMQPDGKFLVAMSKEEQNPSNPTPQSYDFVLYRFNDQGEYDNDFGVEGKVTTSFFNKYDEAFSMVLQADNKIVVAGTTDNGITRDFALARYENSIPVLGVDTVSPNSKLIVYPNPVSTVLNIGFNEKDTAFITRLSIYNMLGQTKFKESSGLTKIDVSHFQPGIYFINIETNKGRLSGKFVKI